MKKRLKEQLRWRSNLSLQFSMPSSRVKWSSSLVVVVVKGTYDVLQVKIASKSLGWKSLKVTNPFWILPSSSFISASFKHNIITTYLFSTLGIQQFVEKWQWRHRVCEEIIVPNKKPLSNYDRSFLEPKMTANYSRLVGSYTYQKTLMKKNCGHHSNQSFLTLRFF